MKKSLIALVLVLCCVGSAVAVEVTLKDLGMSLQVYGYVRGDVAYDTQQTIAGDLAFFVLPEQNGEKDAQTSFTVNQTRFGLKLAGPDSENWKTTGRLEMDFYGGGKDNSPNPRMRLAWIDMAHSSGFSVRAGQDWETFVAVIPRIVNFSYLADAGALGLRRPQVRLSQKVKLAEDTALNMKVAVAETLGGDLDGFGQNDGADAEYPTVQWNLCLSQKLWCEKSARIAFSGHYGQETVDAVNEEGAIIENDATDYDTWSAQASIYLPLTKCLALQGTFWNGENLDTYFGGIQQGVNTTLDTAIAAQGGWAQLLYDPTDKLAFALGYSMDDPKDEDLNTGDRAKNQNILVNGAYKINKAVTVSAEYTHMTTDYLEGEDAENDRIQLAMQYNF